MRAKVRHIPEVIKVLLQAKDLLRRDLQEYRVLQAPRAHPGYLAMGCLDPMGSQVPLVPKAILV